MISHSNSFENGSAYGVKLYPSIIHKYCTMHGTWLYQMNLRLIHLERGPSDFPRGFFQVQWEQDRISDHWMPSYDPDWLTYPKFSWFSNKKISFIPLLMWFKVRLTEFDAFIFNFNIFSGSRTWIYKDFVIDIETACSDISTS